MSRSRAAGLLILALLGVLNIVGLVGFVADLAGPPAWVILTGATLGVLTLIGCGFALAGRSGGVYTVIAARVAAALLSLRVFIDNTAPGWAKVVVGIAIALTVVGVALLATSRRPSTAPVTTA